MYFIIAISIFFVDIFTKHMICKNIKKGEKKEIVKKRFYFWHIKNKGAAYNSFEGHAKAIKCISIMGILYCIFQIIKENKKLGYALLLGGALGNFIERMIKGEVTDFLYFKNIKNTIFNIADVFVLIGAIMIVIETIKEQ